MDDPQRFCSACVVAFGRLQKLETYVEHHESLDALRAAASFCAFCKRIKSHLTEDLERVGSKTALYLYEAREYGSDVQMLQTSSYHENLDEDLVSQGPSRFIGFFILRKVMEGADRLTMPGYVPESYTGSESCLNLARQWLSKCLSEHHLCERPKTTLAQIQWRPTRLLFIDPSQNDSLRLIDGSQIPFGVEYATLSHRWGQTHSHICLRKDKIDEFKVRLPDLTALPAISEAVVIAQRLGFRYLWVDSLCIVQDSVEDWQQECTLMSSVYKYSALNISATSARDGSKGCFWERDPSMTLPIRLAFGGLGSSSRTRGSSGVNDVPEQFAEMRGLFDLQEDQTWFRDVKYSPLNSRGWVLQERILAPRVIHFTSSQLYWECSEMQASESHPLDFPNELHGDVLFKMYSPFSLRPELLNGSSLPLQGHPRKNALMIWADVLITYTRGETNAEGNWVENLTVPTDKLIAVSAIAKELQPYIDSEYLAGHWRVDLERQLGWRGMSVSERPISPYRAPSWSWASVNAPVWLYDLDYPHDSSESSVSLIEILDVQIELAGSDEMGQVKGGFIQIRGRLLEIHIESLSTSRHGSDGEEVFYRAERTMLHVERDDEITGFPVPCQLFCLPLEMIANNDEICFHAILLEQVDKTGTYRRVGYLSPGISLLTQTDLEEDPILRVLGRLDKSDPSAVRFERDLTNLIDLTII